MCGLLSVVCDFNTAVAFVVDDDDVGFDDIESLTVVFLVVVAFGSAGFMLMIFEEVDSIRVAFSFDRVLLLLSFNI